MVRRSSPGGAVVTALPVPTHCPHCLVHVGARLEQHVRDAGDAELQPGRCPVLHAMRNPGRSVVAA